MHIELNREIVQYLLSRFFGVSKSDIFKFYLTFKLFWSKTLDSYLNIWFSINDSKYSDSSSFSLSYFLEGRRQLTKVHGGNKYRKEYCDNLSRRIGLSCYDF